MSSSEPLPCKSLWGDHEVALTPTRDVDAGLATDAVERVVAHLEARGLRPKRATA
jgi:hypothetical protein